jgi:Secretion system C-terminal sorting domain
MKKFLYTLLFGLTLSAGAQAQIKLIGATYNTGTSSIDLLQWSAFDSSTVTTTPTGLESYVFGTSAFDPFNSSYYIAGISGQTTGLYSFNTENNEDSLTTGSLYTNVSEFDMSTGKLYNLIMETEEYISIYEYDIETDQDSLIGTIYEEGVIGIVADAIGFDSNNGILYYVGYTNDPAAALYSIPVRENSFSFTRTILTTPEVNCTITSLNFDNVNEKLFATYDSYDENANYNGRNIVQIDITSGDVYSLGLLSEFDYFVGGSSLFDQNTGTFLLVGITDTNQLEMIAFDTFTNTYTTGFVPNNVSEIQCDNSLFAKSRYATAGIEPQVALNFNLYPNPVSDVLNLECASKGPVQLQIFSSTGTLVYEKNNITANRMNVDMSALSTGVYMVNLTGAKETVSKKILVK